MKVGFDYIGVTVDPKTVRNDEPHSIDEIGWFRLDALPLDLHSTIPIRLKVQKKYFEPYTSNKK